VMIEKPHPESQGSARVEREALERHVEALAHEIGERHVFRPQALAAAADYIQSVWEAQGYEVARHVYEVEGVGCANLEVLRTGVDRPDEVLLIGAHYDSVRGSPGANDNGSGVAALLGLSRLFADITSALTVRFVAFVNEEPPFFYWGQMGSMVYARAARRRGDRIGTMVSLEMLGCYDERPGSQRYPPLFRWFYPDRGDFIAFVANLRSRRALRRFASAFRSHSDFPVETLATLGFVPGVSWSDHLAFWRQGYRALIVAQRKFHHRGDGVTTFR